MLNFEQFPSSKTLVPSRTSSELCSKSPCPEACRRSPLLVTEGRRTSSHPAPILLVSSRTFFRSVFQSHQLDGISNRKFNPASSFARDAQAVASTSVATEHVFKADLPGLRTEDVQVQVEDGRTLSISGQRKKEEVHKTDTWHRVEFSSGQFMRKFRLPENANLPDRITAKVEDGVLTMVVPKQHCEGRNRDQKPKGTTRRIEIGSKL